MAMKRPLKITLILLPLVVIVIACIIQFNRSQEEGVVKIGVLSFTSGTFAEMGKDLVNGIALAREQVNASTEYNGLKFNLCVEDGKAEAKASISGFNKLLLEHIDAAIIAGDNQVPPVAGLVVQSKIPTIATITANSKFLDYNKDVWIFRNFASISLVSGATGTYAGEDIGATTAAMLSMRSEYGEESAKAFRRAFEKVGGRVLAQDTFSESDTDVRSQIAKLLAAKPNVVLVSGYGNGYYIAMNQIREGGFTGTILTGDSISNPESKANIKDLDNIVFANQVVPDNDSYRKFAREYESRFGKAPSMYSAYGYDSMMILVRAIHLGNGSPEQVRKALLGTQDYDSLLGRISFTADGDCVVPICMNRMHADGSSAVLTPKKE